MTDLDLDALEATARAATPGPWMLDGMGEDEPEINYWAHRFIGTAEPNESGSNEIIATSEDGHGPNAEYIAAFDPPTTLALIATIKEVEALLPKWAEARAYNAEAFTTGGIGMMREIDYAGDLRRILTTDTTTKED